MAGSYGSVIAGGIGGTLGGIGDLISGLNYQRPKLKQATGMEQRLRQLAQAQLLAGGQETLGGAALYNQMAPMLMGMLPGMTYHPGTGGGGAGGDGTGPAQSYSDALQNFQQQQAKQRQLTSLNAQIKGMKPGSQRRGLRQERKGLKQDIKSLPTAAQLDRQTYMAGTTPNLSMYDIRPQAAPDLSSLLGPSGSLGAARGFMDGFSGAPPASLLDLYRGAGG